MTTRRGFLSIILAAATAPAIVKAGSLMRIDTRLVVPISQGGDFWKFSDYMDVMDDLIRAKLKALNISEELLSGEPRFSTAEIASRQHQKNITFSERYGRLGLGGFVRASDAQRQATMLRAMPLTWGRA